MCCDPAAESPFINVVTAVEWPRKLNPTSAAAALSSAGSAAGGQFDRIAKCPVVAAIHWANCHNLSPGSYPGSWVSPHSSEQLESATQSLAFLIHFVKIIFSQVTRVFYFVASPDS